MSRAAHPVVVCVNNMDKIGSIGDRLRVDRYSTEEEFKNSYVIFQINTSLPLSLCVWTGPGFNYFFFLEIIESVTLTNPCTFKNPIIELK